MIILTLISLACGLTCPKYKCKPENLNFEKGTCIYYDNSTYFLETCGRDHYCPAISTPGNSTCTPKENPTQKSWPGEPCESNSTCAFGYCRNNTCIGKHWLQKCNITDECHVGLFCSKGICWPQFKEDQECTQDTDCLNNMKCWRLDSEPTGRCQRYFSFKKRYRIYDCQNYESDLCESGACIAPGGNGKGRCIDKIKPNYLVSSCEENSDCPSKSGDWEFYGNCECGINSEGKRYCKPFLGSEEGTSYLELLKLWYESPEVHKCQTVRRSSLTCKANWEHLDSYIYRELEFKHFPLIQGNDECVKEIYTQKYWEAKQKVNTTDSHSLGLVPSLVLLLIS